MSFLKAVRDHYGESESARPTVAAVAVTNGSGRGYAAAALAGEVEAVRTCPAGHTGLPGAGRNHRLFTAARNLAELIHMGGFTEADIEAHLTSAALDSGLEPAEIRPSILSGINKGLQTPRTPKSPPPVPVQRHASGTADDGTWRTPMPLQDSVPVFPTEALGWLEPAVLALAEELQAPPDLIAMLLLATAAAAVRGRRRVQITPGWDEPLNLYVAVVLNAGETKSPALARLAKPLRDLEALLIEEARPRIADATQKHRMQEKRVRQAEDRAVKATGADRYVAEEEARAEQGRLLEMEVPPMPRLLLGDVTPEGLVKMLAEQDGAIASLTAEGGLFDTFAGGRYSGGLANLDAILQAHDGREPILVDRKAGDPIRVDHPCLTLGLAVQPQVLEAIGENEAAQGRGFLARWLYSVPVSRVGSRSVDTRVDSPLLEDLDRAIRGVCTLFGASSECFEDASYKGHFQLSSSSLDLHRDYRRTLERRRHPDTGDLSDMVAWANKLDGQLARLAALLHALDLTRDVSLGISSSKHSELGPDTLSVPPETMQRAIKIGDYLVDHARAAHRMMAPGYGTRSDARQLLGWVLGRPEPEPDFSLRDAHQALRGRVLFHEVDAVQAAIDKLVYRGYLAHADMGPPKPGRPPSPRYLVNPVLTERP